MAKLDLTELFKKQAELDNMCILEEYRKLGIGTQLFLEFKRICKNNNISELKVVASYKNLNAINFYKNNGFVESELILKQTIQCYILFNVDTIRY